MIDQQAIPDGDALPKLPLQTVNHTLNKYKKAIEATVPAEQFAVTCKIIQEFLDEEGLPQAVERFLAQRDVAHQNWAYEWWLEDMYLRNMAPLPVNSNPGWVFPRLRLEAPEQMYHYLARLLSGIADFKQQMEKGELAMEEAAAGKQSLCMMQYNRLLTDYRLPGHQLDVLLTRSPRDVQPNEHIIVMAENKVFKMWLKMDGEWLPESVISNSLASIAQEAASEAALAMDECVSLLTSDSRSHWAKTRQMLISLDEQNKVNLEQIEQCLLVVCLDGLTHNSSDKKRSRNFMFRQMLTGSGPQCKSANRWFDKTIQIVCSLDGVWGINYEHTTSEGVAVVTMIQAILNEIYRQDDEGRDGLDDLEERPQQPLYRRLRWTLNSDIRKAIAQSAANMMSLDQDTCLEVFTFSGYGKDWMKQCRCSPDSYVQMALQLTYFSLHHNLCSTYESASLRRFRNGRVDCIRAAHVPALNWVRSMQSTSAAQSLRKKLFHEAIVAQTEIMKENIFGHGLDLHMLGIRMACSQLWPDKKMALFEDPSYKQSLYFKLSTSQVSIDMPDSYMGYGAVVPDGYGVSYNLKSDSIIFCIGTFYSCPHTSSIGFAEQLNDSLLRIRQLLLEE